MDLYIQIKLIIFSFLFGVYFGFLLDINIDFIKEYSKIKTFIFYCVFMIFNSNFYFYVLEKINNGILHYYSFLFVIIGVIIQNIVVNKLKK